LFFVSLIFPTIFHLGVALLDTHEQLFKAFQTRVAESDYHEHEKDHVGGPTTEIKDLLVGLDHRDQLIVVYSHAYCKVNPTGDSYLL